MVSKICLFTIYDNNIMKNYKPINYDPFYKYKFLE